ncbi:MAG: sigma-70 family RNA polymerase sigma factor [Kofleriaceae bacterium]|nr:sigma-70 family RNA polymerase sigma factor [Kofleriaceae bacterium]
MPSLASSCCCIDWVGGLARAHGRRLVGVARREGLGPPDALDAVQDAFQTLMARTDLDALRQDPDRALATLITITRNHARNQRRRHHRARPHQGVDETQVAPTPTARERLEQAATARQVASCMAELGEPYRLVVTLRVLEELTGEQAARALGVSANHVGVLLHRARRQLASCLADPARG